MLWFSLLTVLLILALLAILHRVEWHGTHATDHRHHPLAVSLEKKEAQLKVKTHVLTQTEVAFYHELYRQLPKTYHIFPQMRLADVVETAKGQKLQATLNRTIQKHLDFVICSPEMRPLVVIEINGRSHTDPRQQARDVQKREICAAAGLPLVSVPVGSVFAYEVSTIISTYHL